VSKALDDFSTSDSPSFGSLIHREPNGYWKPIYPSEVGRALRHIEADYNYKLLTGSLINYRIYPSGQTPFNHNNVEDFSSDEDKFLTLKKDGTDFYWTLQDVTEGGGSGLYQSNLNSNLIMTEDVGGLNSGTSVGDLDGQSISSILDSMLFPTSYPTYTQPSVSLASIGSYFIIGEEINVTLTTGANRGLINNTWDGTNQGPYAGTVSSADYIQNNGSPISLSFSGTNISDDTVYDYVVQSGLNEWQLRVTFNDGITPIDSTGNQILGANYVSGTESASRSFQGSLPIFLGNVNNTYDQRALNYSINGNNIECLQNYEDDASIGLAHRIKIPVDLIGGRTLTIQYYNSLSPANPWQEYGTTSTAWIVTTENINLNSNNTTVPYLVYTKDLNIHQGAEVNYRLNFT
jgi:hypothetical protein